MYKYTYIYMYMYVYIYVCINMKCKSSMVVNYQTSSNIISNLYFGLSFWGFKKHASFNRALVTSGDHSIHSYLSIIDRFTYGPPIVMIHRIISLRCVFSFYL